MSSVIRHFFSYASMSLSNPGLSNARQKGIAKGAWPFAGARGVLAPSSSPSRRRRQKGELESPVSEAFPLTVGE